MFVIYAKGKSWGIKFSQGGGKRGGEKKRKKGRERRKKREKKKEKFLQVKGKNSTTIL